MWLWKMFINMKLLHVPLTVLDGSVAEGFLVIPIGHIGGVGNGGAILESGLVDGSGFAFTDDADQFVPPTGIGVLFGMIISGSAIESLVMYLALEECLLVVIGKL